MLNKNLNKFLQFRESPVDVTAIEKENNCSLPPVYRSFVTVFKPYFGNITFLNSETNEVHDFVAHIYSNLEKSEYTIDDDELALEEFIDAHELFSNSTSKNYVENHGVLPISHHGYAASLVVGVNEQNQDLIYLMTDSTELKLLANNIFELLTKIHIVTVNYDFPDLDTSKFYRDFGEDFWRVR